MDIEDFDYSLLIEKIRIKYATQDDFAKDLGIGRVSLSQRLNNKAQFRQNEMRRAAKCLGIEKADIPKYFFKQEVQKHEQTED